MSGINEALSAVKTLKEFKSAVGQLTIAERKNLVEDAILLMEQVYAYTFLSKMLCTALIPFED